MATLGSTPSVCTWVDVFWEIFVRICIVFSVVPGRIPCIVFWLSAYVFSARIRLRYEVSMYWTVLI